MGVIRNRYLRLHKKIVVGGDGMPPLPTTIANGAQQRNELPEDAAHRHEVLPRSRDGMRKR